MYIIENCSIDFSPQKEGKDVIAEWCQKYGGVCGYKKNCLSVCIDAIIFASSSMNGLCTEHSTDNKPHFI